MLTSAEIYAILYMLLPISAIWAVCTIPYLREARRLRRLQAALLETRQPRYSGRRNIFRIK